MGSQCACFTSTAFFSAAFPHHPLARYSDTIGELIKATDRPAESYCGLRVAERARIEPVPTKPRPEDVFIAAFLSAYEDLTWADAEKDWLDRRIDDAVEMLATRSSDGKTLAIEHTLIQPFVSDKEDFAFFGPSFLKIEDDRALIVADKWIQVFVPVGTLNGYPKPASRRIIVKAVHEWIKARSFTLPDGDSEHQCAVTGMPGKGDFEITLTIKVTPLPGDGSIQVRRQQVGNDFADVIRRALITKLPKLTKQKADKRVLILERQHMNLRSEQILVEVRKQAVEIRKQDPYFPQLAQVDEIWILETVDDEPGGVFFFELKDENNSHLSTMSFHGEVWISRSGKDGISIRNYAASN